MTIDETFAPPPRALVVPKALTRTTLRDTGNKLPLIIQALNDDVDLPAYIRNRRDELFALLRMHGGILFKGFRMASPDDFAASATAFGFPLLPYAERTSPRVELRPNVYTSTEHPPDQIIHFHNANAYSHSWPQYIWFGSLTAAAEGGHTPIADCRVVYGLIDPEVRAEFERRGVTYLRNFHPNIGLSWKVAYQTEDPAVVRAYCEAAGARIEYFEGDRLRVRQTRRAVHVHPITGEKVWFNQAHLYNIASGFEPSLARTFQTTFEERDLPRNSYFGDGGQIDPAMLKHIVECYDRARVSEPWQEGDFLILDNMLVAHARGKFKGKRLTVVAFAELYEGPRHGA